MNLKRPGIEVDTNVCVFETELNATKPEIKQYLEKIYGLNPIAVNTLRTNGKIKMTMSRKRFRESDKKKAYVYIDQEVPQEFRKATKKYDK